MIKKVEPPIRHNTHYVMNRGERMMQDTMVGKKFGNLVVQKLAYRGKIQRNTGNASVAVAESVLSRNPI